MIVFETLADAIRAQLAAAGVAGGNVERDRNEPTTEFELPCCQVMVASDRAVPDGDPRTGLPRFEHTLTIAAIAYDRADTGLALKGKLAAHAEAILSSLLGNLAWQGNVVEGLAGLRQIYESPPDGEEISGRVQVQVDVMLRSSWPPPAPQDDFASVSAGVAVPSGTPQPGIVIDVPTT